MKEALAEVGIMGMTLSEVKGAGRTGGRKEVYRGSAYVVDFVPKIKVEIVAADGQVADILQAIERASKTGKIGDGKIFVSNVIEAVRAIEPASTANKPSEVAGGRRSRGASACDRGPDRPAGEPSDRVDELARIDGLGNERVKPGS